MGSCPSVMRVPSLAGWMSPHSWGSDLLDLFLPPACAGCGTHLPRPRSGLRRRGAPRICPGCRSRLRTPPHPRCGRCDAPRGTGREPDGPCPECHEWPETLRSARAAVVLRPPADALVHALKYGGWPELGAELASRMVPLVHALDAAGAAGPLVPVPTTPGRLKSRGYNQARVLADTLDRVAGHPMVDAMERAEGGRSQVALQPGERRANVQRAFSLRDGMRAKLRGRTVVLVDDVLTTGSTASAAAEVLVEGGAVGVHLITFARALPG